MNGNDTVDGGSGFDWVSYDLGATGPVTVDLQEGVASGAGVGNDKLDHIEGVIGTAWNDTLIGDDNPNDVEGRGGHDTIEGGSGKDSLYGGEGLDVVNGGAGDDWLVGGAGADTLSGNGGEDSLVYTLPAELDGDSVTGGTFGQTPESLAIIDRLVLVGSGTFDLGKAAVIREIDRIDLAPRFDTLEVVLTSEMAGTASADGNSQMGDVVVMGYDGTDTAASPKATTIPVGIDGRALTAVQSLRVSGQPGSGFDGDNALGGLSGNDTLRGGAGDDSLNGGHGDDWITGGKGFDTLVGGAGNDSLEGGDGNDLHIGGQGADTMTGGPLDDIFRIAAGESGVTTATADVITDFVAGVDRLRLPIAGTSTNFLLVTLAGTAGNDLPTVEAAVAQASFLSQATYLYLFDSLGGVDGFLVGDLDGNGAADLAIRLVGLTSSSGLLFGDIVAGGG
jgi:Ca2+-binding RTX toxin-like protein